MSRLAARAAALLAAYAFLRLASYESSVAFGVLLGIAAAVAAFFAFYYLWRDPSAASPEQRRMLVAALVVIVASWVVSGTARTVPDTATRVFVHSLGLLCGVLLVALPLWRLAGRERWLLGAAATAVAVLGTAAVLLVRHPEPSLTVADAVTAQAWLAYLLAAIGAGVLAWRLSRAAPGGYVSPEGYRPRSVPPAMPRPSSVGKRVVIARMPARVTEEDKARRLAALEAEFQQGRMAEHVYLDKRQEIESL